jgi:hypothetical protein
MNRRVDQKLHLVKLTLAAIDFLPSAEKNPALETALVESALFHLHIAYQAYLHELVQNCKARFVEKVLSTVETAQQTTAMLQSQQLCSADIDELAEMERSGDWPAQLHVAYANATNLDIVEERVPSAGIVLRDVSTRVDVSALISWLQRFHELIVRQREHAREC